VRVHRIIVRLYAYTADARIHMTTLPKERPAPVCDEGSRSSTIVDRLERLTAQHPRLVRALEKEDPSELHK